MDVEHTFNPAICCGNHYWVTAVDEPDMTDEPFVQDLVNNAAFIGSPVRQAL
jgi:hypothetical protein